MADSIPDLTATLRERFTLSGTALVSHAKDFETELGDVKQPDFKPQVKVKRFDNEVNLSVRRALDADELMDVSYEGAQIVCRSPRRELRFYDLGFDEDGGFEFEEWLQERPDSNVLTFTLQTKGLEFLYQQPLGPLTEDGSCSIPDVKFGGTRYQRPGVPGSYAVYADGLRDDYSRMGGKNYGTGKVCHIYRPWAEDALGARVWCDLHVDPAAGLLTITVPQAFLDSATYPVLVDPTFGFTGVGGTELSGSSHVNRFFGSKGTPAGNGTVDSITARTNGNSDRTVKGAIVLASTKTIITNGVSNSQNLSGLVGGGTATVCTMPTPPSVTAVEYYIGYLGGGSDPWGSHFYDAGQPAANALYDSSNNFTTPTDPTDGSEEAERVSCYATYTASGGGDTRGHLIGGDLVGSALLGTGLVH